MACPSGLSPATAAIAPQYCLNPARPVFIFRQRRRSKGEPNQSIQPVFKFILGMKEAGNRGFPERKLQPAD